MGTWLTFLHESRWRSTIRDVRFGKTVSHVPTHPLDSRLTRTKRSASIVDSWSSLGTIFRVFSGEIMSDSLGPGIGTVLASRGNRSKKPIAEKDVLG